MDHRCTSRGYLKVVRQNPAMSAKCTGQERAEDGEYPPLVGKVRAVFHEKILDLWVSLHAF